MDQCSCVCGTPELQSSGATDSYRRPGMFLPERIGRSAAPARRPTALCMDGAGVGSGDRREEEVEEVAEVINKKVSTNKKGWLVFRPLGMNKQVHFQVARGW